MAYPELWYFREGSLLYVILDRIRIVSGKEKERVKVVKEGPDNLLVSWIPGERMYCEDSRSKTGRRFYWFILILRR
jgi:hypothetical protein